MRRLSQRLRLFLPWVGILLALTGILLLKSCSSAQPVSNLNPPAVVQPESSPFPSGTQPPPEPQSLPETQPSFDPNSGFPPETSAQILNASEIDGIPLTVGQSITLQGSSAAIEWRDSTGRVLGQGSQVVYQAQDVRMETITAWIGQAAQSRVSFTVSTPDIVIAPHVKVIPDEVADGVDFGEANGILTLPIDDRIPTLKVGDVLIGAAGKVPPLKVASLEQQDGLWLLAVQPALPKELIEQGTATFEQEIDWSGESGEVTLVDIPPEPFHIGDTLDPKWSGFVQAGDPIDRGLKVTASASLDWKPTYSGYIVFDESVEGLKQFSLLQNAPLSANINLEAEGYYDWRSPYTIVPLEAAQSKIIQIKLGPVPIPIRLEMIPEIEYEASIFVNGKAQLTWKQQEAELEEFIIYDSIQNWNHDIVFKEGEWSGQTKPGTDSLGVLVTSLHPLVRIELPWVESESGVHFNAVGLSIPIALNLDANDTESELKASLSGYTTTALAGISSYTTGLSSAEKSQVERLALPLIPISYLIATKVILPAAAAYVGYEIIENTDLQATITKAIEEAGINFSSLLENNFSQLVRLNDIFESAIAKLLSDSETIPVLPDGSQAKNLEELRAQLEAQLQIEIDEPSLPTPTPSPVSDPTIIPFPTPTSTGIDPGCDPEEFAAWANQFVENAPQRPKAFWWKYEDAVCGKLQYRVSGGGETVIADAINIDECLLVDCKYSCGEFGNYVTGWNPEVNFSIDQQFRRYTAIIRDPSNPVRGLEIKVNRRDMRFYFDEFFSRNRTPGRITFQPAKLS